MKGLTNPRVRTGRAEEFNSGWVFAYESEVALKSKGEGTAVVLAAAVMLELDGESILSAIGVDSLVR
jgi:hypothetical protein